MSETYGSSVSIVKPLLRNFVLAGLWVIVASGWAMAKEFRIVGLGDSLTAGFMLSEGDAFPARLENALRDGGLNVSVANAGVSGDTTSGGLERLGWSVPDGTNLVILELGANDALRGIAPEITEHNLDEMITRLKKRGIGVLLAGMLAPPNMGNDYAQAFDAIFPRLAKEHDVPLYPFFLEGVATHRNLLLADGMHPNRDGVQQIVERMLPLVEKSIKQLQLE